MTDPVPASLPTALALAEYGFGVFSVWGIKDGHCLCPKGAACPDSPGKHPIPHNGFKAASLDPERIRTMLRAAGSAGNYGVCPAENTIIIDVDGEGWQERLRALGLPKTLAVTTGNGIHLYFYWAPSFGPAPTHLFGWKVRSTAHEGYVVGPGSQHQNGTYYRFAHQNGHSDYDMVARISAFPAELVPQEKRPTLGLAPIQNATITVSEGPKQPESVGAGEGRHDYLRDTAYHLSRRGLTGDVLFEAVWQVNLRFPQPKDEAAVRRAIGEVEKFGVDADVVDLTTIPVGSLIVKVSDYHASNASIPVYVSPLAAYGTVSLVSGPPKGGKSTLISNLLAARETNTVFLWGDPVPTGPSLLVTEEGGYPVVRKTQGLTALDILDRMAFAIAGLRSLDHLLAVLDTWVTDASLVVIDTLAVWGDIKDENDAVAATTAITALRVWAQRTGSAVILVHHTRKGGGDHGEAVRGSGGIFAAVDQSVELAFTNDKQSDDRGLDIAGRLAFGETKTLAFDRTTMTYSVTASAFISPFPIDQFPTSTSGQPGLTRQDAETIWGVSPAEANKRLKEHVEAGRLAKTLVKDGRTFRGDYHRVILLDLSADTRGVGERMADLFKEAGS